ncbi:Oidioi.mRNA.OKI2018_I69.PAR.g12506.t1.cds [Oikopleura dioica]|uniref:Oidioi.mRNA.OKI2018_I69.PAR.g12506.t1.cds n=1 Tax=Oikopleura dioica TaxID=34765 RepID=A0ABN7S0X3_OIKDI|nr:Oidioi.mRNA.OKI2018_I69.PAR.g12506.t1.cds [Oikopleura dioica]
MQNGDRSVANLNASSGLFSDGKVENDLQKQKLDSERKRKRPPNIVFMLGDDHGQGDLPWTNDYLSDKLPNLMKMRRRSTLVENHYTAAKCSPSRGQIMTGRNHEKTGFNYIAEHCLDKFLPPNMPFMSEYFKQIGYKTHHVGKWHLGFGHWTQTPTAKGFDTSYHTLGGYADYWNFQSTSPPNCKNAQGLFAGYDMYNATTADGRSHVYNRADVKNTDEYLTYHMTDVAKDIILNSNEPFLLYNAFHAPHFPLHAPKELRVQFLDDLAPESAIPRSLTNRGETRDSIIVKLDSVAHLGPFVSTREHILGDSLRNYGNFKFNVDDAEERDYVLRVARAMYFSNVKALDIAIGEIFEALENAGKLDNTIVIYAGDNGAAVENFQSSGDLRGYKGGAFEGGVRTFALISGPGINPGATYKGIFQSTDWLPTLLAATDQYKLPLEALDGVNQFEAITSLEQPGPRQEAHLFYSRTDKRKLKNRTQVGPLFAMRWKNFKIIGGMPKMELSKGKQMDNEQPFMWYSFPEKSILQDQIELGSNNDWKSADPWNENQQWWLFNLENDPNERKNLLRTCKSSCYEDYAVFHQLRKKIQAHKSTMRDLAPKPVPEGAPKCSPLGSRNWKDCWWVPGYLDITE